MHLSITPDDSLSLVAVIVSTLSLPIGLSDTQDTQDLGACVYPRHYHLHLIPSAKEGSTKAQSGVDGHLDGEPRLVGDGSGEGPEDVSFGVRGNCREGDEQYW